MTAIYLRTSQTGNRQTRVRLLIGSLVFLAFAGSTSALAAMYKWTDNDGVLHYSSVAPEKSTFDVKRLDSKALDVSRARTPANYRKTVEPVVAPDLNSKVEALERQVEQERQARVAADQQNMATQAAYAQALVEQQSARNVAYQQTIPVLTSGMILSAPHHWNHHDECGAGSTGDCRRDDHRSQQHELQQGSAGIISRRQK